MQGLVLQGGNALQLAYDITNRGSIDILLYGKRVYDKDFENLRVGEYLNEFAEIGLVLTKVFKEPKKTIPEWRGYDLELKLIEREKFEKFGDDIEL